MAENSIGMSIIVPAYNKPQHLLECLAALTASSYPGAESIVVDDASTDDVASVAAQIGADLLRLATNSGPAARNYGARHARGAFSSSLTPMSLSCEKR
jgi:glycosyltransferase involved in cell wall biosynthesis